MRESSSELGRAQRRWFHLMPQFQAEVPDPLGDQLPAFLSPGRLATPPVGIDLLVFIGEQGLKGTTMQVQLDHIAGGEGVLRKVGEEEFVDDACARDSDGTFLFRGWMGSHDHSAQHSSRSHRHLWTVVETADHLAFWALLELIRGEVQTRLDQRMVEHAVVLPSRHKREARYLGECSPRTILPVESEQRMRRFELIRGEIACDRSQSLAQFLPVMAVPFVSETAEPMIAMGLRNRCARANNLPAFAASVARGAHVIQPTKGWRKLIGLGQRTLPRCLSRPIDVEHDPGGSCSIQQVSSLLVGREGPNEQIVEKQRAQGFHRCFCQRR